MARSKKAIRRTGRRSGTSKKTYGKTAGQKRRGYGDYIPKYTGGGRTAFKKFADKVIHAAAEAKKFTMTCGIGNFSNMPYCNKYVDVEWDQTNPTPTPLTLPDNYKVNDNPTLGQQVSYYGTTLLSDQFYRVMSTYPWGYSGSDGTGMIALVRKVPAYSYFFPLAYTEGSYQSQG